MDFGDNIGDNIGNIIRNISREFPNDKIFGIKIQGKIQKHLFIHDMNFSKTERKWLDKYISRDDRFNLFEIKIDNINCLHDEWDIEGIEKYGIILSFYSFETIISILLNYENLSQDHQKFVVL